MKEDAVEARDRVREAGADDVAVKATRSRDRQVRFSRGEVDVVKTWREEVVDVFAAFDGSVVTTRVRGLERLEDAVASLRRTAEAGEPSGDYVGIAEGPFEYTFRRPDPELGDLEPDAVHDAIDAARDAGAERVAGTLRVRDVRTAVATTGGCVAEEPWGGVEVSVRAFRDGASGHTVRCATRAGDLDLADVGERAARFASQAGEPEAAEAGKRRVLFEPLIFATLLDGYAGMFGAYDVRSGLSVFDPDDVGSKVAGSAVTLVDDPARRDGLGHRAFDDEGRPTRPVTLLEDGRLETFLHNTSTAEAFDAEPTASAGLVSPGPSTVVLRPGGASRQELLEELGDGLWLTNAWYTRYQNRTTGAFSTLPRDACLVVEDGEVAGSVSGLRLSDNLRELMERVELVGAEAEQVLWWAEVQTPTFTPPVVVDDVAFTTSRV